jgi:thioredoxin reductase (NADPH)
LHIRQYEWVKTITGEDGNFRVTTTDRHDAIHDYRARKIVLATGYYDLANQIDFPAKTSTRFSITTASRILISTPTWW